MEGERGERRGVVMGESSDMESSPLPVLEGTAGGQEALKSLWARTLRGYVAYLRTTRGMSENTVEAYSHDVALLRDYILSQDAVGPGEVTQNQLEALLYEVGTDDLLGIRSQARLLSGWRSFFRYMGLEQAMAHDPMELLDPPKQGIYLPDFLEEAEVDAMERTIDLSEPNGPRNLAIIETLYSCGLRVSELCDLRLSQILRNEGFIQVIGKGDKERIVPIGEQALHAIDNYLPVRAAARIRPEARDMLFISRNGTGIKRVMVFLIVRKAAQAAGIQKKVTPHTLRHSFATSLVRGGADLRVVQAMLGHASIVTTELYTHLTQNDMRSAVQRFHPRGQVERK